MKKIYLIAASFLGLVMISCDNAPATTPSTISTTQQVGATSYSGIVYMNSDSLISGYKMYKDLSTDFRIKSEKIEKELQGRASKFETSYRTLESDMQKGLITRTEAQAKGEELKKEQQVILQYRDQKLAELQEEEMVMMNKISVAIQSYVEKYNEAKKYQMIINTSSSTNVVITGDKNLDVTKELLDGLNSEYIPE